MVMMTQHVTHVYSEGGGRWRGRKRGQRKENEAVTQWGVLARHQRLHNMLHSRKGGRLQHLQRYMRHCF